ncbi:MAG: PD-(D/E)XK nuclease family protein [Oscillospiraceae bacterium]|jgi:ATP-dependent helicase/nuclease subunit B|nr:PD-(D/E)XK nuclease family protein [Oscillospiraceae bacterium]
MGEIKRRASLGETGLTLLVPEQYSHSAERQLSAAVGDSLSLHGEALSFTRLCNRVFSETGGACGTLLDGGGQILALYRALSAAAPSLRVYGSREKRAEFLEKLLYAIREFKSSAVTPDALRRASLSASGALTDKLYDLSVILAAYDAFLSGGGGLADPNDRLTLLAEYIGGSAYASGRMYVDGFHDFTARELRVLEELIRSGAELTFCLTCDGLYGGGELFTAPRATAAALLRFAEEHGVPCEITEMQETSDGRPPELLFLERELFGHGGGHFEGENRAVEIYGAPAAYAECEYAAAKTLELVRGGLRFRDVAVVSRGAETYGALCENVFERYGIPAFSSGGADILQKPPIALITAALEIVTSGWTYDPVFRYLKTGLGGLAPAECDALENYVIRWNIRGSRWTRPAPWSFGGEPDARLDALRRRVTEPIEALKAGLKASELCGDKLRALYGFLERVELPRALAERAEKLTRSGFARLAAEYGQLWDILKTALEQCVGYMGDSAVTDAELLRVLTLVLSQYEVGVIPVALDRVMLGDMAKSRRRDVKCLIVLGATDELLPRAAEPGGVLSDAERGELQALGVTLSDSAENRVYAELNTIYSALTLPTEKLIVCYPSGGGSRPSVIVTRMKTMFNITESRVPEGEALSAAEKPCFELAVMTPENALSAAARAYFSRGEVSEKLRAALTAPSDPRGSLSPEAAETLYGRKLTLSATRVEKFYSCKFAYFLQNGLRARPRVQAGFDAPEAGTFMHYILENVTRALTATGGFKTADDVMCAELTERYVRLYMDREFPDWDERTERFRYLFRRVAGDTKRIVLDMVRELKKSEFAPLDFELRFETAVDDGLTVRGFVDRVDGWVHGGELYLRVVDYKTGKKSFNLSDLWYGLGMQMLIYIFALQGDPGKYGRTVVPAGVLYAPARDVMLTAGTNLPDEVIESELSKKLRRSGVVLDDIAALEAMESGPDKKYLPVKFMKDGLPSGDALLSAERLGRLSAHVGDMLKALARELRGGAVAADPYYKGPADNACNYCDFRAACHFDEQRGDARRPAPKLTAREFWAKLGEEEEV